MGILENLEPSKNKVQEDLEHDEALEASKDEPKASLVQEAFGRPGAEAPKAQQGAAGGDKAIKPHVDHNTISGLFNALGTVLTHPVQAVTSGLSGLFVVAQGARELAKSVSNLATVEGLSGLALTKVDVNTWQSEDKAVAVEAKTIAGDKAAENLAGYLDLFDKQVESGEIRVRSKKPETTDETETMTPKSGNIRQIDLNSDIYTQRGDNPLVIKDRSSEKSTSYVNANGENATVTVAPDSVHFAARKDGVTVTDGWQLKNLSTITHKGETATLDTLLGKLAVSAEQLKILQKDGNQEIQLSDGLRIERSENGTMNLLGDGGILLQRLTEDALTIGNDVAVVGENSNLQDAANRLEESPVRLVLDRITGRAYAKLGDGLSIMLDAKKNAVIEAETGEVMMVANDGKVYILQNGKYVKVPCEKTRIGKIDVDETGNVTFGNLKIGTQSITSTDFDLDLANQQMRYRNGSRGHRSVHYGERENGFKIETDDQEVSVLNDIITSLTKPKGGAAPREFTYNIADQSLATKDLVVTPTETRIIHADGRADTVIKPDNTVIFDGGQGPILHHNGGIRFDDRTHVDQRGNVTSGDWQASTAYAAAQRSEHTNNPAGIEGAAVQAASHGSSKAMSVYGKASSGMVTMSDIDVLSQNLSDVTALIAQLAAVGRMDLVGQLQNTCGIIMQTITYALPRAQAAQDAAHQTTSDILRKQNAA